MWYLIVSIPDLCNLIILNNYFQVDSDISLAVSTRIIRTPYCLILTFEDDFTYKHAKDKSDGNSFLLPVLSKYNGYIVEGSYNELLCRLF